MIRLPSPWLSAGAGLAAGVPQGLMLGMEAGRQRREEEQRRQAQAMQLLLGFSKMAAQDPDTAKALEAQIAPVWKQLTGKPWTSPKFLSAQEQAQKQIAQFQTIYGSLPEDIPDTERRVIAGSMMGFHLPTPKEKPPTYMRDASGNLIPLEPGTKIVGGSGYPPASQMPSYYQPVDQFGQPAGPPIAGPHGTHFGTPSGFKEEGKQEPAQIPTTQDIKDYYTAKEEYLAGKDKEKNAAVIRKWGGQIGEKPTVTKTHPWGRVGEVFGVKGEKIRGKEPSVTDPEDMRISRRMPGAAQRGGGGQKYYLKKNGVPVEVDKATFDAYWQKYGDAGR